MIMTEETPTYNYFLWFKCKYCEEGDTGKKPCIKRVPLYINTYLTQDQITKDFKKDFEKDVDRRYGVKCLGNVNQQHVDWELITFDEVIKMSKLDDTINHKTVKVEEPVIDRFSDLDLQGDDP